MSYLFIVEGVAVIPTPETLLISPFKEIWERDTSADKEIARAEFKYIEFMTSVLKTNPYKGYSGDRKETEIRNAIGFSEDRPIDDLMKEGIAAIHKFQKEASESYQYYLSAKKAVEKMRHFNNTFDLTQVNPKTFNLMLKPKDVTNALKDTEAILTNFESLKIKVEEEVYAKAKMRSDKKVSPFAKKSSFKAI